MISVIERRQLDIAARLEAHPFFADVNVFAVRPRASESFAIIADKVNKANAGILKKNGKAGLTLQVLMPTVDVKTPESIRLVLRTTYVIRVQELAAINMGPSGTGISAEEAALEAMTVLQSFMPGPSNAFMTDPNALTPSDAFDPLITYDLRMIQLMGIYQQDRARLPIISIADDSVAISAEGGAAIRYTLDGSYPTAAAGTLYTSAFATPAAGVELRAIALVDGKQQSDIAYLKF